MLVTETFHGYIETTQDVLLIFEGCRRGLLPRICRRLQERERKMIRSGSIFVFDERESGIKRWTDGRVWSPSRILGNFLIYRELDKKSMSQEKKMSISSTASDNNSIIAVQTADTTQTIRRSFSLDNSQQGSIDRNKERQLVGSLSDSYRFKEDGLIKKTMSIMVNGVAQHLISYYDPNEVLEEKLRAPSSVPELTSLEISPELLVKQNFRIPPLVEPTFDNTNDSSNSSNDRNNSNSSMMHQQHPLRSMSVGSLRGLQHHHQQQQDQHMMLRNNSISHESLLYNNGAAAINAVAAAHSRPHSPIHFGPSPTTSLPNIPHYNNNATTTNSTMPSPSSLSSSPSTPMLSSPIRQSFNQHPHSRHYSTSSISSGSLPRFDPRNYSTASSQSASDNNNNNHNNNRSSSLGHIMPVAGSTASANSPSATNAVNMTEHYQHQHNDRFASPNHLGQLLNPIHPLNTNTSASNHDLLHSMGLGATNTANQPTNGSYDYHSNTDSSTPTTSTTSSSLRNSISQQEDHTSNNNNNNVTAEYMQQHYYQQQQQQQRHQQQQSLYQQQQQQQQNNHYNQFASMLSTANHHHHGNATPTTTTSNVDFMTGTGTQQGQDSYLTSNDNSNSFVLK